MTLKIFCYHLTEDCRHYFFSYFSKTCFEKQILMVFTHLQSIDSFTYPGLKHYAILFLNFAWHLYFLFGLISYFWFLCKLNETPTETFLLSDFFIWQILFPLASELFLSCFYFMIFSINYCKHSHKHCCTLYILESRKIQ